MHQARSWRKRAVAAAIAASFTVGILALPSPATANPIDPDRLSALPSDQKIDVPADQKIADSLTASEGKVTVFVRLDLPAVIDKVADPTAAEENPSVVAKVEQGITAKAEEIVAAADASQEYLTTNVIAGVVITADAAKLRELAERDDVVSVKPIIAKSRTNSGADLLTGATKSWQTSGALGKGTRIAIIDSGVDYTHADFGGLGTIDAYNAAKASATPLYPTDTKFQGGYDFAGDDYEAGKTSPKPDANPLDCETGGHGTHVAGTAAGVGVNADGTPFNGDYRTLTDDDVKSMRIGPGSAPGATLVPYRVFGCSGSTNLVPQALDMAWKDNVNVINMSLGSDFSAADDPENDLIDKMSASGIVSVISSGNGGDVTDTGGSPGSSRSALTVANSVDSYFTVDGVEITSPMPPPATVPPVLTGQYSQFSDWNAPLDSLTAAGAEVVSLSQAGNLDGCNTLNATDKARVAGKIAYLEWDDVTRNCGSGVRWGKVRDAGAVGVVIFTAEPFFSAGIAGVEQIPGIQLNKASSEAFRPYIDSGYRIRFDQQLKGSQHYSDQSTADMINPGSSRGVHGSIGISKPDVAAPGTAIFSAGVATGDHGALMSGTSMSAPHVAGITATLVGRHPLWTPAQIKAAIMNTATHDVYSEPNRSGLIYGPARVGSGRVDAAQATDVGVLAFDSASPAGVTSSFGIVEVGADPLTVERKVTVQNTTPNNVTLGVEFQDTTPVEGVAYSVSPPTVAVQAGTSTEVTVRLDVTDPAALRKTMDATMSDVGPSLGNPRDYVPAAEGRLILKPTGPATAGVPADGLRVPVSSVVRPHSEMKAAAPVLFTDDTASDADLLLDGRSLELGDLGTASSYNSVLAPFELAATSPRLEPPVDPTLKGIYEAGDISHVGVNSSVPQIPATATDAELEDEAMVNFGVAVYGDLSTPGQIIIPHVFIDVDGDGREDYIARTYRLSPDDDTLAVITYDATWGFITGVYALNGAMPDRLDTNIFDTSTVAMPVNLSAIGFDAEDIRSGNANFTYELATLSPYAEGASSVVDEVPAQSFDPTNPGVWFGNVGEVGNLFTDKPGAVSVHRTSSDERNLLLLHLHNKSGDRAEIITASTLGAAAITIDPTTVERGGKVTVTGTGFAPSEDVAFELHSTPVALGGVTANADGTISAEVTIPADTAAGAHVLVAKAGPRLASAPLTVTAAAVEPGTGSGTDTGAGAAKPGQGLEVTGTHIAGLVILAMLLLGAGGVLVARRRQTGLE